MPLSWTPEQVLSLAPDESAQKNASGLAQARKWMRRLCSDSPNVIWGEIQGSGKDPYRAQVDLDGPAFKCTCPSKKLPCKHALGLFLLFATQPKTFETAQPPEWVMEWLGKRAEAAQRKVAKAEAVLNATPEEQSVKAGAQAKAQAKRVADRDKKIRAGLDELEVWLRDLLRQGLNTAQSQPPAFWETPAARLVDAQAPGLGRLVRGMAELAVSGEGWQERLLDQMGRLYLALEGYRRIETLPEPQQADLRAVIGFNLKQEDLISLPGVSDTWLVLGREIEEEAGLKVQRVWLWGQRTNRPALILNFAAGGGMLDASLTPGMAVPAELVYYPGAYPLRAILRKREPAQNLPPALPGCATLSEATAGYATALASFPWLERYPLVVSQVWPTAENGEWLVVDQTSRRLPLAKSFRHGWTLTALSGGGPMGLFGEWNGERLLPLSAWADGAFTAFRPKME